MLIFSTNVTFHNLTLEVVKGFNINSINED